MITLCLWMIVGAFVSFTLIAILNEFDNLFDVISWFCALALIFTTVALYENVKRVEYYESIVPIEKQYEVYEKEQEIQKLIKDKEYLVGDLQK